MDINYGKPLKHQRVADFFGPRVKVEGMKSPPVRRRSKSAPANKNAELDGMMLGPTKGVDR